MLHHTRKIFLMLYSIYLPNFILWLPLCLEILGNMYIALICCPVCNLTNFEFNLNFRVSRFPTLSKSLEKILNIVSTERAFDMK